MTPDPSPETRAAQRRATYDFNIAHAALARKAQAAAARWCLTALLAIHAGVLLLAGAGGDSAPWGSYRLASCGLLLALAAGLANWLNWTMMADVHTRWADDRLLNPQDERPVEEPRLRKRIADIAWLAALFCAAASLAAAVATLGSLGG